MTKAFLRLGTNQRMANVKLEGNARVTGQESEARVERHKGSWRYRTWVALVCVVVRTEGWGSRYVAARRWIHILEPSGIESQVVERAVRWNPPSGVLAHKHI